MDVETINYNEDIKLPNCDKERSIVIVNIEKAIKYTIDAVAGVVGIIILIPLTAVIYIINKIIGDDGPIFYTQERIGKNGKIFKMFKYRTMVVGADEKLKEYLNSNKEARDEYKKYKKLKNDPRVTKIGEFLRKTSLDEMPQMINLLKGEMSLVGPRPYLVREKDDIGKYYSIITKCTPGITGYWQINGRSNATFDERLDLDIMYYKKMSLAVDIKILFMTFLKVFKKDGAR